MVADNMKYLDSIISYDYGSNQNAEYEIYGAPTVADVQKFAEGLLNIHRFLGVKVVKSPFAALNWGVHANDSAAYLVLSTGLVVPVWMV